MAERWIETVRNECLDLVSYSDAGMSILLFVVTRVITTAGDRIAPSTSLAHQKPISTIRLPSLPATFVAETCSAV